MSTDVGSNTEVVNGHMLNRETSVFYTEVFTGEWVGHLMEFGLEKV